MRPVCFVVMPVWQLKATLDDLRRSVSQVDDPAAKIALDGIVQRLAPLVA